MLRETDRRKKATAPLGYRRKRVIATQRKSRGQMWGFLGATDRVKVVKF